MTAVTLGPVLHPGKNKISDRDRRACLEWLSRVWDELGVEKYQLLEAWAHPSLGRARRDALMADYAETTALVQGLQDGWVSWDLAYPDLTCNGSDPQDRAVEYAGDRAGELLYALLNGENQ